MNTTEYKHRKAKGIQWLFFTFASCAIAISFIIEHTKLFEGLADFFFPAFGYEIIAGASNGRQINAAAAYDMARFITGVAFNVGYVSIYTAIGSLLIRGSPTAQRSLFANSIFFLGIITTLAAAMFSLSSLGLDDGAELSTIAHRSATAVSATAWGLVLRLFIRYGLEPDVLVSQEPESPVSQRNIAEITLMLPDEHVITRMQVIADQLETIAGTLSATPHTLAAFAAEFKTLTEETRGTAHAFREVGGAAGSLGKIGESMSQLRRYVENLGKSVEVAVRRMDRFVAPTAEKVEHANTQIAHAIDALTNNAETLSAYVVDASTNAREGARSASEVLQETEQLIQSLRRAQSEVARLVEEARRTSREYS